MGSFRPNVGNHTSFGITAYRIFKKIGQLVLTIGNVVSLLITESNYNLLKKR